jgi:hypothetical protein
MPGGRTSGRPWPPRSGDGVAARRGVEPDHAWGEARGAACGRCVQASSVAAISDRRAPRIGCPPCGRRVALCGIRAATVCRLPVCTYMGTELGAAEWHSAESALRRSADYQSAPTRAQNLEPQSGTLRDPCCDGVQTASLHLHGHRTWSRRVALCGIRAATVCRLPVCTYTGTELGAAEWHSAECVLRPCADYQSAPTGPFRLASPHDRDGRDGRG